MSDPLQAPKSPEQLFSTSDRIALVGVILNVVLLAVAGWALFSALDLEKITLRTTQANSALSLLDDSVVILEQLKNQRNFLDVLGGKDVSKEDTAAIETVLGTYRTYIFRAAYLKDADLVPSDIWQAFVEDFCRVYSTYPFMRGWWGWQRTRQPYNKLSKNYRELSNSC